jgi:alcohol dehydrogenase class IV
MLNNGNFCFFCRTKVEFGMNALEHLPFDLAGMGRQKPLVLLDKQALLGGCLRPLTRAFKESKMTLGPFVYIPTGMGTGMETHTLARFNGNTFHSPFLAPDLAVIDPDILTINDSASLINTGLTCLSVCCEAHVLSGNPVARAYAATGIGLLMENFLPLVKQILVPTPP